MHVRILLQDLQGRTARRDVLIKKPASAGFFMPAGDEKEMKGRAVCYYGGL
jgi:hypothetical protein